MRNKKTYFVIPSEVEESQTTELLKQLSGMGSLRAGRDDNFSTLNSQLSTRKGFTFIELILYVSIISIMLAALIPFTWNMVEGASRSAVQQEVSSNARLISERIKYEVRNASGINSVTSSSISLSNTNAAQNPTIITYTAPNVTIKQGAGSTINLNSADVNITSFTFTNNTSGDNKTKNISFTFAIQQAYTGARADLKSSMTIQSSAELRTN